MCRFLMLKFLLLRENQKLFLKTASTGMMLKSCNFRICVKFEFIRVLTLKLQLLGKETNRSFKNR